MRGGAYSNRETWVGGLETSVRTALPSCLSVPHCGMNKKITNVLDKQQKLIFSDLKLVGMKTKLKNMQALDCNAGKFEGQIIK